MPRGLQGVNVLARVCVLVQMVLAWKSGRGGRALSPSMVLCPSSFLAWTCTAYHVLRPADGGRCHSAPHPDWGWRRAPAGSPPQPGERSSAERRGLAHPGLLDMRRWKGLVFSLQVRVRGTLLLHEASVDPAGQ